MTHTIQLNQEEFRTLQRADYEMAGMQVLLREFTSSGTPALDAAIVPALIQQYQIANANLKQAQLAIYKNHKDVIPFDASLNFNFRDETASWED